jgi:hypothetical protein
MVTYQSLWQLPSVRSDAERAETFFLAVYDRNVGQPVPTLGRVENERPPSGPLHRAAFLYLG